MGFVLVEKNRIFACPGMQALLPLLPLRFVAGLAAAIARGCKRAVRPRTEKK